MALFIELRFVEINNAEKKSFTKRKIKIALIFTGGTIGSSILPSNKIIEPMLGSELYSELLKQKPGIEDKYEFILKYPLNMLSENITPSNWGKIAESIAFEINKDVDGIVVTHGTDTMPYTISAVSFMISEIPLPVVFTGSLIPPHEKGTDAIQNLYDSILFAAKSESRGVFLVFGDRKSNHSNVFWGNRLRSIFPYGNNFQSADCKPFATIKNDTIKYHGEYPKKYHLSKDVGIETKIESKVAYFKIYPGFDPWFIEKAVEHGVKGIILELYHSGTACTTNDSTYSLVSTIKSYAKKGIPIFGIPSHELPKSLFSWDKIPGDDNVRLIDYLTQKFGVDWVKVSKIEKIDDGRTIRVTNGINFLSLRLNDEETKVNIEIDDGRTDIFMVKAENGKLNIHPISNIYGTTEELLKADLIHLNQMSLESALVKLMWLLGSENEIKNVIKKMNKNIAGEIFKILQN